MKETYFDGVTKRMGIITNNNTHVQQVVFTLVSTERRRIERAQIFLGCVLTLFTILTINHFIIKHFDCYRRNMREKYYLFDYKLLIFWNFDE